MRVRAFYLHARLLHDVPLARSCLCARSVRRAAPPPRAFAGVCRVKIDRWTRNSDKCRSLKCPALTPSSRTCASVVDRLRSPWAPTAAAPYIRIPRRSSRGQQTSQTQLHAAVASQAVMRVQACKIIACICTASHARPSALLPARTSLIHLFQRRLFSSSPPQCSALLLGFSHVSSR
jgi:hypothetical protein